MMAPSLPATQPCVTADLATRLRAATQTLHDRIEQLPAAQAMAAACIGRDVYVSLLNQLLPIHQTLEEAIGCHGDLYGFGHLKTGRVPALRNDLRSLGATGVNDPGTATRMLMESIRGWSDRSPWSLIGCLYVLEGSRMGSMVLVDPLSRALGVPLAPGWGLDYHLDGMAGRPLAWRQFRGILQASPLGPGQQDDVVAAAVATFQGLHDLYASLTPEGGCEPLAAPHFVVDG
ncbi:MAG: biliverdin-producing heme oxygenase [Gemmataceae bacterium]|nr:biliverdin-producing heme oxygenase [Gemmataceae bacterium]